MPLLLALATLTATPTSLPNAIANAQPGDTVRLTPGDYGTVTISNRQWPRAITIEAGTAQMALVIRRSSGINIRSGRFKAVPGALGYAAQVQMSSRISFNGSTFVDSPRALVIDRSTDLVANRLTITGMTIDGVDIASSQRIVITNSVCSGFNTGKAHPDCIQMWSSPTAGVTTDVTLAGNRSIGNMQGFTAFNHVRNGVDDGGFDRITIKDSVVQGLYPQGIALYDCRKCVATGNRTSRLPGARWKVSINVIRSPDARVADNQVGP